MAKQVKTTKILNFLNGIRDKDLLNYYVWGENQLEISFEVCERRKYPIEVAKKYKSKIDRFVKAWNDTAFSKGQKLKPLNVEEYKEDDYSEYEIEVGYCVSIKIGKNQEKYFKK